MKRTIIATLAALALVACGGSSAEPTAPTPPATVARIEYITGTALLFTGRAVPLRALVRAYDAVGNELPSSTLALALSPGWTLDGDSLVAPTSERTGALTASGRAAATEASASHSASVADGVALTAAIDLRAFRWTASWRCTQPAPGAAIVGNDGTPVDSALFRGFVVDSVVYPTDSGFVRSIDFRGLAQLWVSGDKVDYLRDGRTDTTAITPVIVVARQAPDSIFFRDPEGGDPVAAVRSAPGEYQGATWCSHSWSGERGAVTFTGTPSP
jgi:hypothetical protein